jgi:hypothetical protein
MGSSRKEKAEEAQLAELAKRILAMPHKTREESKLGKSRLKDAPKKRTAGKGRARVGKAKR